ncbi:MAG: SDR family NAD(P)-dependent oxidoreductase [Arenibacterium sp.]
MSGRLAILGGCGGIGRDLVTASRSAGWEPVVFDLAKSIEAHPVDAPSFACDASDPKSLQAALQQGPEAYDGFVNLCGFMTENRPLAEQDDAVWREVIDGNLSAAFYAARAFAPLLTSGAAIVNTGSGLGHFARPGYGPYAISKAGIAAITRQLALELAPEIRVNCVAPSAVDTAFLRGGTGRSQEDEPARIDIDAYTNAIPLKRIAVASDVTGPILFLLSEQAAYVTGQVLHINGGTFMP